MRPLERLEAVASTVRETKDYSLRMRLRQQATRSAGVTAAFNDMLAELAAARAAGDGANRRSLRALTRLTDDGGDGGLDRARGQSAAGRDRDQRQRRRCAGWRMPRPISTKAHAALQRVVRDGHRASEVIGSVRAMFKRDMQETAPRSARQRVRRGGPCACVRGRAARAQDISVRTELG